MIVNEKDLFVKRLRNVMTAEGITARTLFRRCDIPESLGRSWLQGRCIPSLVNIRKLSVGTGWSADYWVGLQ